MNKQSWIVFVVTIFILLLTVLIFGNIDIGKTKTGTSIIDRDTFIDDAGNMINVERTYDRIISLDGQHTTNLFYMGVEKKIIGVNTASIFPPKAASFPRYTLTKEYDIEQIIKENPDLILISPELNRKYPGPITRLETAGLKVVSLRPNDFNEFDIYIEKLAMLTGKQDIVQQRLDAFHMKLKVIYEKSMKANIKNKIFIESSEQGYLTPAIDSLPYLGIQYAGGENIARDVKPINPIEKNAYFGLNNVLKNAGEIDVYVTLQGGENPGASIISIKQKSEFNQIKAIQEGRILELSNTLINEYTFRYEIGVNEIARALYPDIFDDLTQYRNKELLTRRTFAEIVTKYYHLPLYVNHNTSFFDYKKYNHTYGSFADVEWQDESFDFIETVVMRSYITGKSNLNGDVYFEPEALVTRADVAVFLNIIHDLRQREGAVRILDIGKFENKSVIQKVVDNGLMSVEDGYFNPNGTYTNEEFIAFLESMKK